MRAKVTSYAVTIASFSPCPRVALRARISGTVIFDGDLAARSIPLEIGVSWYGAGLVFDELGLDLFHGRPHGVVFDQHRRDQ